MKSLLCAGNGRVTVAEVPDPQPQPGQALVRIDASAVCGTEHGALVDGFDGNVGHEACGTIIDPGTPQFAVGQRVGIGAFTGCGRCDRCVAGQELHCRRGPTAVHRGWHAELAAVPVAALRELPNGTDPRIGVLLTGDTLGVPTRGLRRAPSGPGDHVVIIGLGPVGLGHVVVRAFTGAEVVGIDPSAYRRELALQLGATGVFAPGDDVRVRPQVVIECTGRPECIAQALELVDNGGWVLQSGECYTEVAIRPSETFIRREITYTGSWYYATEDYPRMCELLDMGLPLDALCTHDVPAADAQAAITDFLEARSGKVVLRWT